MNPFGGIPVLELDDGSHLAESVAICLLYFMMPVGMVWIHGSPLTASVVKQQIPAVAEQNRGVVARTFELLDRELAGRAFFAGDDYSMADIVGLTSFDFAAELNGLHPPAGLSHLARWHAAVTGRPSARAGTRQG